ncbi:MAG: hypothetical protein ACRDNB_05570 [Gaiellaceae bacterium]
MTKTALVALGAATLALASHAGAADAPTCTWSPNPYTSVTEGNTGTTSASLDLVCANPTSATFTVAFSTLDGWAVSPADFGAASGDVSVPPGDSTARVSVDVVGTGTASETPYDWRPIYTLGPVPLRSAGAASATVTYTVVAQ